MNIRPVFQVVGVNAHDCLCIAAYFFKPNRIVEMTILTQKQLFCGKYFQYPKLRAINGVLFGEIKHSAARGNGRHNGGKGRQHLFCPFRAGSVGSFSLLRRGRFFMLVVGWIEGVRAFYFTGQRALINLTAKAMRG